jgi:prepilin-type N-terminal cleavage/methylation domain-containing protein
MRHTPRKHAFTMVEILVVIAIMTLLVTLAISVSRSVMIEIRSKNTVMQLTAVHNKIMDYYETFHAFPGTTDTASLVRDYLDAKMPDTDLEAALSEGGFFDGGIRDAWDQPVGYGYWTGDRGNWTWHHGGGGSSQARDHSLTKSRAPVLVSPGADGSYGTADDILVPN